MSQKRNSHNTNSQFFLAVDGDNIGSKLERLILLGELEELRAFSKSFAAGLAALENAFAHTFAADIIFAGGDNFLASCNSSDFDTESLKTFVRDFEMSVGQTVSIGVGETPFEAHIALKLAKCTGKNSIRYYHELHHA
jgi:GTP cyclohydrolase III